MPKSRKQRASNSAVLAAKPYNLGQKKVSQQRSLNASNLIAPNTSIGQHFLKNPAVVNSIVQKAGVKVSLATFIGLL